MPKRSVSISRLANLRSSMSLAAGGEILQRLGARSVGAQFQLKLGEFGGQIGIGDAQAAAGVENRRVQALPGFDRQHHADRAPPASPRRNRPTRRAASRSSTRSGSR